MLQWWEIAAVFAVSLGASGVYALVSFIGSLTAHQALSSQHVIINGTQAKNGSNRVNARTVTMAVTGQKLGAASSEGETP